MREDGAIRFKCVSEASLAWLLLQTRLKEPTLLATSDDIVIMDVITSLSCQNKY